MLRRLIAAFAVLAFVAVMAAPTALFSAEKKYSEAQLKQQQKMKDCAQDWNQHKEKTGASGQTAYRAYMSDCLRGRPISAAAKAKDPAEERKKKAQEAAEQRAAKKKEADDKKAVAKKQDDNEASSKKEKADAAKKKKKEEADAEKQEKKEKADAAKKEKKEKADAAKKKKKEDDEEKKAKKKAA